MFVLETEMVMKMYYKLYEKKFSSLDTKHDIQVCIIHKGNSIPVNVVAKCKEQVNK